MELDSLRFKSGGRTARMVQSVLAITIAAFPIAGTLIASFLIRCVISLPPMSLWHAVRGLGNGLTAWAWYGYKMIAINWRD